MWYRKTMERKPKFDWHPSPRRPRSPSSVTSSSSSAFSSRRPSFTSDAGDSFVSAEDCFEEDEPGIARELLSTNFTSYSHEPPTIESLYPNRDFLELLSAKSSTDHIWEALNNKYFYIIGVYGMGGVGKTTIMKEVAKRAKNKGLYNEVIMVTVSQNQDVKRMQTEIAQQLGLQLTTESERVRRDKILTRIKGARKILIILDDLWGYLDISKIGIPSADENKECKVVITTRVLQVCIFMECKKHILVEPLSEKESWDLFKLTVGDVLEKTDNLTKVAVDVAKEISGVPLAIRTLGRAMRNMDDITTWIDVRSELQQSTQTLIPHPVLVCIRRSFDYLSSDEAKLCFLLCSLFPEDWEIYIIDFYRYVVGEGILQHVYSMEEAWNRVCRLLDELKDCCLLLEGWDSEHFKMHDVVRDVAIWISSDKTYGFHGFVNWGLERWPEIGQVDERQRISCKGISFDSLPEQPIFPRLRTMILKETQLSTIPDRFFRRMEALLVLDIRSKKVASLPSSFPCLVNLKALFLSHGNDLFLFRGDENFDVTSLSLIGELKNLEILQLRGFEFGTVPKEFGNLMSLRCLDLLVCRGTIPRNLISRLARLEQLYLTGVFSNWQVEDEGSSSGDSSEGCATFAEIASLSCLTTLHVDIENTDIFLQQDLNFGRWLALTDFKIVLGIRLSGFGFQPRRSRSKILEITKSTYKWVINLVTQTETLYLHNWSGMALLSMPEMKRLWTYGKQSKLEIKKCHKLIDVLPTSMLLRTHQRMKSLVIDSCGRLQKVLILNFVQEEEDGQSAAAGIVLLPRLESIYLEDLPELRSVWGGDDDGVIMLPGSLQNLESLYIRGCKSLKDHILPPILPIPNKLVNFPSLRSLSIWGCDSLTYLLSWRQAKGLPHLRSLEVGYCPRMETVIKATTDDDDKSLASVVLLPQLDSIHLYFLPKLTNFCEYLEDFPSLRELHISGCYSLTYLLSWRQAKGLPHLQYLHVSECDRMETLIKEEEDVGGATDKEEEESTVLPSLTGLSLRSLPMLRSFQGDQQCSKSVLPSFKSLKELELAECPKLKKLPLSSSPVLESLVGDSWEWFESLEWEDESIKERLRAVFEVPSTRT